MHRSQPGPFDCPYPYPAMQYTALSALRSRARCRETPAGDPRLELAFALDPSLPRSSLAAESVRRRWLNDDGSLPEVALLLTLKGVARPERVVLLPRFALMWPRLPPPHPSLAHIQRSVALRRKPLWAYETFQRSLLATLPLLLVMPADRSSRFLRCLPLAAKATISSNRDAGARPWLSLSKQPQDDALPGALPFGASSLLWAAPQLLRPSLRS